MHADSRLIMHEYKFLSHEKTELLINCYLQRRSDQPGISVNQSINQSIIIQVHLAHWH